MDIIVGQTSADTTLRMTPQEFREAGVLWAINKGFLHPHGLSLGLAISDDDTVEEFTLEGSVDGEWSMMPEMDEERQPAWLKTLEHFGWRTYHAEKED